MGPVAQDNAGVFSKCLPSWLRQEIPDMEHIRQMKGLFRQADLSTVCESAFCPNMGRCWGEGVASFMILGDLCTRSCRFCGVRPGRPMDVNPREPEQVALAVQKLGLRYAVITSVTRDDLPDAGARQFALTVAAIRERIPQTKIELLIPDFAGDRENLKKVMKAMPDVIGHNVETVRRLSPAIRPQADYGRSLQVLRNLKEMDPSMLVKSGFMVGLGETRQEVEETLKDLALAGCDMATVGQYLSPGKEKRHVPVQRFVPPEEFTFYKDLGRELGFKHVMSGPLVRGSYAAEQGYRESIDH
jgi:lipoic acid synthetase